MGASSLFKIVLFISIFALAYFSYLVYISYYPPTKYVNEIQFFGELLTLPLLGAVLFSFSFSIINIIRNKARGKYAIVFIVNTLLIVFLIYVTYIQMKK